MRDPRIFLGVVEIAGYLQNLFLGFRKLGYDAGYLNINAFNFNYNAYEGENYRLLNFLIKLAKKANSGTGIPRLFYKAAYWLVKIPVFVWCLFQFDVFIFCAGSSFFWFMDYRILKLFKKKIIYVSLGSDSRPAYMNGAYKDDTAEGAFDPQAVLASSRATFNRIKTIEKYADILINYPQHAHFHSRTFISGNYIGFPTRLTAEVAPKPDDPNGSVRILHAPTRPKAKGSLVFRQIIKELQDEGLNIDFIEITGKTNQEVLQEIAKSDIVLDELYSDLPLGGLGSEAACLGRPVIVGGWFADMIADHVSADELPPSFYCSPTAIKNVLKEVVLNPSLRLKSGKELRTFLENRWAVELVAKKYIQLISNNFPSEWSFSPPKIEYLNGWGISQKELEDNIHSLLSNFGAPALFLPHNPSLVNRFSKLVEGNR